MFLGGTGEKLKNYFEQLYRNTHICTHTLEFALMSEVKTRDDVKSLCDHPKTELEPLEWFHNLWNRRLGNLTPLISAEPY